VTTREEKYDIVAKHLSTQEKTHRGKYAYNEWLTEYTGLKKSEEKITRGASPSTLLQLSREKKKGSTRHLGIRHIAEPKRRRLTRRNFEGPSSAAWMNKSGEYQRVHGSAKYVYPEIRISCASSTLR